MYRFQPRITFLLADLKHPPFLFVNIQDYDVLCFRDTKACVRDDRAFRDIGKHLEGIDFSWKISREILLGQDGIRGFCSYSRLACIVFT